MKQLPILQLITGCIILSTLFSCKSNQSALTSISMVSPDEMTEYEDYGYDEDYIGGTFSPFLTRHIDIPQLQVDASSIFKGMILYVSYEEAVIRLNNSRNDEVLVNRLYTQPEKLDLSDLTQLATLFKPGSEQYRDVYELIAYRYPESSTAQLNAAAAALSQGDKESARYFLEQVKTNPRALNNLGVLALMDGYPDEATDYFRRALPQNPSLARKNLKVIEEMKDPYYSSIR